MVEVHAYSFWRNPPVLFRIYPGAGRSRSTKIIAARLRPFAGSPGKKSTSLGPPRPAQGEREGVSGLLGAYVCVCSWV